MTTPKLEQIFIKSIDDLKNNHAGEYVEHKTRPIEILNGYPYTFRCDRRSEAQGAVHYEICEEYQDENNDNHIFVRIPMNFRIGKEDKERILCVAKRLLIAEHYIHNPDPAKYHDVMFSDNNKLNFDPKNLFWCTYEQQRTISRKFRARVFIESLPEDVVPITNVNNYSFDKYFYHPSSNQVITRTRHKNYQIVHPAKHGNTLQVTMQDTSKVSRSFSLNTVLKALNLK